MRKFFLALSDAVSKSYRVKLSPPNLNGKAAEIRMTVKPSHLTVFFLYNAAMQEICSETVNVSEQQPCYVVLTIYLIFLRSIKS